MKRQIVLGSVACLLVFSSVWGAYLKIGGAAGEMTESANKWLGSLSPEQRTKCVMAYDAPERLDWHFIPKPTRKGLQIKDMKPEQRTVALALLRASLSQAGYDKATKIMELEAVLDELEKGRENRMIRDTERYYFTVFGQPSETERWGLSIEGHHMSLNFVVDKGRVVSTTPSMFGSNPAVMKTNVIPRVKAGTRILAAEEQLAYDLLKSLSPDQRKTAVIAEEALKEVRNDGKPQPLVEAPAGLPAAKMNAEQKAVLQKLITAYAGNVPDEVAKERLTDIEKGGFDQVHFAWAGSDQPGAGHYYRIQGSSFLIEFVNTQPDAAGNPANHIHCLWRDVRGDFAIPISKS